MKRNFGLDIYRSIAILMVLAAHSLAFFYTRWFNIIPLLYVFGLGVEIFFALSGYLIGGILIRDVVETRRVASPMQNLLAFYVRRWLRTLPLYYLMVVVTVIVTKWSGYILFSKINKTILLVNLFFVQNFNQKWLIFQPVSWSLSIEEWFYLLIPLPLVAISLVKRPQLRSNLVLVYGVAVVVLVLVYRGADFLLNHSTWDFGTRQQIFMHMDALMFGVLAAWLKYYHAGAYARLAHSRWFGWSAAIAAALAAYMFVYVPEANQTIDRSLMEHTLSLTIIGICFAALVMAFQGSFVATERTPAWVVACFQYVSTRSYGYYLIHYPVIILLSQYAQVGDLMQNVALNAAALGITVIVAAVVYSLFELPIMNLRDRISIVPKPSPSVLAPSLPDL